MLFPLDNFPENEEKFGKQSAFHPMCCITTSFIDEGYSIDDLIKLYKKKIMQSDPLANHILTATTLCDGTISIQKHQPSKSD